MADVGAYGKNSDSIIFQRSKIGRRFLNRQMDLPAPSPLPDSDIVAPYTMVGDEAFPLTEYMLRPYPGVQSSADPSKAHFNHRLSRARRIVENAFGIFAQRFRIYFSPIALPPKHVKIVVMSSLLLHNCLTPSSFDLNTNERNPFLPMDPQGPQPPENRTAAERQKTYFGLN